MKHDSCWRRFPWLVSIRKRRSKWRLGWTLKRRNKMVSWCTTRIGSLRRMRKWAASLRWGERITLQLHTWQIEYCPFRTSSPFFFRPQVREQELGSLASSSATFSNLLTTSRILNTQKNTGTIHISNKIWIFHSKKRKTMHETLHADSSQLKF